MMGKGYKSRFGGEGMHIRINLMRIFLPGYIFALIAVGGLCLFSALSSISIFMPIAGFIAFLLSGFLIVRRKFPYVDLRSVYDITPVRVTQSVNGKILKDLTRVEGMRVYRRAGLLNYHCLLLYARIDLPMGIELEKWKDSPDVIIIPYDFMLMSKLARVYEGAMPI